MEGHIEGSCRRGQQTMRWLNEWYNRFSGHKFEQTLGDSEGQGILSCCGPWCCKESDTTERLNNNKSNTGTKTHRKQGTKLMTL